MSLPFHSKVRLSAERPTAYAGLEEKHPGLKHPGLEPPRIKAHRTKAP